MALEPGIRLGAYEILALLGAGGMGEVYRARDTRLGRDVALKILPPTFVNDPERLARFRREAQVLAAVNHPNIGAIYGLEDVNGAQFIVLELVDGESLAQRLSRGPLPIDEALAIAEQIADALEAAHQRGIIHRDLKPANIALTRAGSVKILDFGLAKAPAAVIGPSADLANSPTMTSPAMMTGVGVILGTAAYMAPEQAKGKEIDRRVDLWAFGAVLYEMLTGRPAFTGETITDVLAAVVTRDPDWQALPATTPQAVRRVLLRCLQRDPKRRLRDVGDARLELETTATTDPPVAVDVRRRGLPAWTIAFAILATAGVAAAIVWVAWPSSPAAPVRRFDLHARDLRVDPMRHPVISPDGRRIAWSAGGSLWIRDLDRADPRVAVRDVDPMHLAWSPDSEEVLFFSGNRIWRIRAAGGEPVVVAEAGFRRGFMTPGAGWQRDGRIVFAPSANASGLLAVSARGGEFQSIFQPPAGVSDLHSPHVLPDDRGVLVVVDRAREGADSIQVIAGGKLQPLIEARGERFEAPVYSSSGHLVYERTFAQRGIWAVPFSLDQLKVTGEPFLAAANASWPSVSADGTLVHSRADAGIAFELAIVDRAKGTTLTIGQPGVAMFAPRISPDGRRVAFTLRDETGGRDVYVQDIASGARTRLTFGASATTPVWMRGNRILFQMGALATIGMGDTAVVSADGGGSVRVLAKNAYDPTITPDGRRLLFYRPMNQSGADILGIALDPDTAVPLAAAAETTVLATPANERAPKVDPSGTLLAYESEETGRRELYVTTFPEPHGKWQVSNGGADFSMWHPSGDRLVYSLGSRVYEVPVTRHPAVTIGTPSVVLEEEPARLMLAQLFDLTPDGTGFVVVRRPQGESETLGIITVVEHWFEEFRPRR